MDETIYVVEDDDDEQSEVKVGSQQLEARFPGPKYMQTIKKQSEMLFVRGIARTFYLLILYGIVDLDIR